MSLLPNQMIPQGIPFGTVQGGNVYISENWWLLLYNMAKQSIGTGSAASTNPAQSVIPSGSPFAYTAPSAGYLSIVGGLVSKITVTRGSTTIGIGISAQLFPAEQGDVVTVTYGEAPTMTFFPS